MFFVSASALTFEVALTRICSVLLQYHLSFAVVSLAVLGVGLGGLLAFALRRGGGPGDLPGMALIALGPAIAVALVVVLRLPFATGWPWLLFLVLPPFVAAGTFLSLVLRANVERAGSLYAADLAGGAAGALGAVAALGLLGGPVNAALVLALAAAGVAWAWTGGRGRGARLAPAGFAIVLGVALAHAAAGWLEVDYGRAPQKLLTRMLRPTPQGTPHLLPGLGRWDAYSRVDVLELDAPRGVQRHVFIDGETPTPMLPARAVEPSAASLAVEDALAALPLRWRTAVPRAAEVRTVLSIGSGGGYDVVLARRFGAARVDAVELNAGVLAVVEAARDFTGDVYHQPGVRCFHAEGRQFTRRALPASYDLVLLALAQSLAGNLQEYALSESYLYTCEAFEDYLRVLRPGGELAFLVSDPLVQEKLVRTASVVLSRRGVDPTQCVIALTSPREVPYDHLVLLRTSPYDAAECAALGSDVESHAYAVLQVPAGVAPQAPREATPSRRRAAGDGVQRILTPATDERPFFFHLEPGTPAGLRLLLAIAWVALGATLGVLALGIGHRASPTAFEGSAARGSSRRASLAAGAYFMLLGLAFMMVEILTLQRTILVIGFPTLNLALVLASFLVAAGCGSAASARLTRRRTLALGLLGLGLALAGLMPLLGALRGPLERLPLVLRSLALFGVLFPFGFAMGMPFPSGLRLLPTPLQPLLPWLWGVNGVASIAGSALVVAVVLEVGFARTGLLPAALYALASLPLASFARAGGYSPPPHPPA